MSGDNPILLIFPPGWGHNVGGAHIGIPLIKGFLQSRRIPVDILDLNIGIAEHFHVKITESDVLAACQQPSLGNLNQPYNEVGNKLNNIADKFHGTWDIQGGFRHHEYNSSSSESVRAFSQQQSPFTHYFVSEIIPTIEKKRPLVLGFSVTVPGQLQPTFELCRLLRNAGYDGKIILGGNAITRIGEDLFLDWVFDIVDGVIIYQGEYALVEIWEVLQHGGILDRVPNLVWRKEGQIICNEIRLLDAKDFVGPDFDGLPVNDYWGVSYLPIIGARGCYYGQCSFCAIPYAWGKKGYLGCATPQSVYSDMKRLYEAHGFNRFKFVEESLHPHFMVMLSDLINMESFECYLEGYARFDTFWDDLDLLRKVSKAGLQKLYIGLEICFSDQRKVLNKSDSAKYVEILMKLHDVGIKTHLFCMFGYPGTEIEDACLTVEFLLKHPELIDTVDIAPFSLAKHTKVAGMKPVVKEDWALEYIYTSESKDILPHNQIVELSAQLEELLWNEHAYWLHPIYRMYSPWQKSISKVTYSKRSSLYRK